jgi:hypothetical protein
MDTGRTWAPTMAPDAQREDHRAGRPRPVCQQVLQRLADPSTSCTATAGRASHDQLLG